jgi:hypothetical protein
MNKRLCLCLASLTFLAGCYAPLEEYQRNTVEIEDETFYVVETKEEREMGKYAYQYRHAPTIAKINKVPNLCSKNAVLYVKIHNHSSINSDAFTNIVMTTLEDNEFFDEVVTRTPTIYINVEPDLFEETPSGIRWYDTDDPLSIYEIKKRYPDVNFLILEVRMQEFDRYDPLVVSWDLIDPNGGVSIASFRQSQAAWYWANDTQTKRMIKDFNHWFNTVNQYCECQCTIDSENDIVVDEESDEDENSIKVIVEKSGNYMKSLIYR